MPRHSRLEAAVLRHHFLVRCRGLGRLAVGVALGGALWSAPLAGEWPPIAHQRGPEEFPEAAGDAQRARADHPVLGDFVAEHGDWLVFPDSRAGGIGRAFGPGLPLPPVLEPGEDLTARAARWLAGRPALSAVPVDELSERVPLGPDRTGSAPRWLIFRQTHEGLPVLGADLTVVVRDERVVYLAGRALGRVAASPRPRLTPAGALGAVADLVGVPELRITRDEGLAYLPRPAGNGAAAGVSHILIQRLEVLPLGDVEAWHAWHAWVDAHSGRVVALFPRALSTAACEANPDRARGEVRGGIQPNRADEPEVSRVLSRAPVTDAGLLGETDLNGSFAFGGSTTSSHLRGDRFYVVCDDCDQQALDQGDAGGRIDFGLGGGRLGFPVIGNGKSTPAERTAFYHLEQGHQLLDKWDTVGFPTIDTFVNANGTCNAFSDTVQLFFFKEGGGCNNLGLIRDIMQHELGHTWDRFDGVPIGLEFVKGRALSEWRADSLALLMGGDACIGESYRQSGGPSATCSGVRDLDEKATGRSGGPGQPDAGPTAACPTCPVMTLTSKPQSCQEHCLGQIYGQALWHLKQNLLTGVDYATGTPLPPGNPALSPEQAKWLLEKLFLAGGPPIAVFEPANQGVSVYDAILIEDDEDGNLANGTPHAAYINAAWTHHGAQETPTIADAANCAAPADAPVSASVEPHPVTGRPRVRLDWPGGLSYDVGRNWRAQDAWLPLATDVPGGPVYDDNVGIGETIHYLVATRGAPTCPMISPGANVVSVTVEWPEVRVGAVDVSEIAGDGDGVPEPGETLSVAIDLAETSGTAAATEVEATLSSIDPEAGVAPATPLAYGTIPSSGLAPSPGSFTVAVSPAASCGSSLALRVGIGGQQGCWSDQVDLPLGGFPCAPTSGPFIVPVGVLPGSLVDSGDFDGIPDNCEIDTYEFAVKNVGDQFSGPVSATVESILPGAIIVGGGTLSSPGLAPDAEATALVTLDMAGLAPGDPVRLRVTSAGAGQPPAVRDYVLPGEEDPPAWGTVTFTFESGFEGWVPEGFNRSTARATSGLHSVHAGSTSVPLLCNHLTSPVLRLRPDAGSTLTMRVYADIEPFTDAWYDRANLHLVSLETGQHTLLTPNPGGVTYNASGGEPGHICHVSRDAGWAGQLLTFGTATFNLAPWAGQDIRLELNYSSDEFDDDPGLWVDDVSLTNATLFPADGQPAACAHAPEVSAPGALVPLRIERAGAADLLATWEDLGTAYQYNVYSGTLGAWFSHFTDPLDCGSEAVSCDGTSCALTTALPADSRYYLVTATIGMREGPSGFTSLGLQRDPTQDSCGP